MDKPNNLDKLSTTSSQLSYPSVKRQIKQPVIELYEYSETGNYTSLSNLTKNNCFSDIRLNIALRKLINKIQFANSYSSNYYECLSILLNLNISINYQFPDESNSTILMRLCQKNDLDLIKKTMDIYMVKEEETDNKKENIDYTLIDNKNKNFLFYLFKKYCNEEESLSIFIYFVNYFNRNNLNVNINDLINSKDHKGNTLLGKCIKKGWSKFMTNIIFYVPFQQTVNNNKNNYLHLAIISKNILCLKIALLNSSLSDIKQKNNLLLTPIQLANKKGYLLFSKIINFYQNNCTNELIKEYFTNEGIFYGFNPVNLMAKLQDYDFDFIYFFLNQYEMYQSVLLNSDLYTNNANNNSTVEVNSHKMLYSSIKWNFLFCKYKQYFNLQNIVKYKDNVIFINFTGDQGSNSLGRKNNYNLLKEFDDFFMSISNEKLNILFNNINPMEISVNEKNKYLTYSNNQIGTLSELPALEIIILNKLIYFSKKMDLVSTVETIEICFENFQTITEKFYYRWIFLVNSSFILIDILLFYNYIELADLILDYIEDFLLNLFNEKMFQNSTPDMVKVFCYLNENCIFNQNSYTWDETFGYLNLLKAMRYIKESDEFLDYYCRLINNCNYLNELNVFRNLKIFYLTLNIKKSYFENNILQFKYDIEEINKEYLQEEEKIIIYNSIGIIFMKQGMFHAAEIQFIIGLKIYKKLSLNKNLFFQIRFEFIYYMKYNLGLAFFFQKKYKKAYEVFIKLSKASFFKFNIALWYRIGLCILEIVIQKINYDKNCKGYNDMFKNVKIIYEGGGNENKGNGFSGNSLDCINSILLENEEDENFNFFSDNMTNQSLNNNSSATVKKSNNKKKNNLKKNSANSLGNNISINNCNTNKKNNNSNKSNANNNLNSNMNPNLNSNTNKMNYSYNNFLFNSSSNQSSFKNHSLFFPLVSDYGLLNTIDSPNTKNDEQNEELNDIYIQFEKECGDINILNDYLKRTKKQKNNISSNSNSNLNQNNSDTLIISTDKNSSSNTTISNNDLPQNSNKSSAQSNGSKETKIKFILNSNKLNKYQYKKKSQLNSNIGNSLQLNQEANYSLDEAILAFKQVLIIKNTNILQKESISHIISYYGRDKQINSDNNYYRNYTGCTYEIIMNSFINLLFCFSLKEDYLSILFYIKIYENKLENYDKYLYIIETFRIEAYIRLKKFKEAQEKIVMLISDVINNESDFKVDLFSKYNHNIYSNLTYKNNLIYGLILINIKNNNLKLVNKYTNKLCNIYKENNEELPLHLLLLLLYINIIKYNSNNNIENNNYYSKNIIYILKLKRINNKLTDNKKY